MSNLVMEFSRVEASDRGFLRVLLDSGGGIDQDSAYTPHTSELRHGAAFTPETEIYRNPGHVLYNLTTPYRLRIGSEGRSGTIQQRYFRHCFHPQ